MEFLDSNEIAVEQGNCKLSFNTIYYFMNMSLQTYFPSSFKYKWGIIQ